MTQAAIGFGRETKEGADEDAIKKLFSPEFRNRLDAVVPFSSLSEDIIERIVDKFIVELEIQLEERDVTIELGAKARSWLAKKGYDPLYGARPLGRVIQEEVKKHLAEELLFGKLVKGGHVHIDLDKNDKIVLEITPAKGKGPKGKSAKDKAEVV